MLQVKIFKSDDYKRLERDINTWLKKGKYFTIRFVKQSVSRSAIAGSTYIYISVWYEVLETYDKEENLKSAKEREKEEIGFIIDSVGAKHPIESYR